ncbi:MAG: fatty acid desaturase [Nonomuraea sp.]|nr:fatty acid desaturase [Nonomuraea sp.]
MWKFPAYAIVLILTVWFGSTYSGPLEPLVKGAALTVGALQFIGVFGLMHESAHGHLARSGKVNRLIGEVLSVVVGTSYTGYRIAHLTHHARFRTERDPQEVIFPRRPKPMTVALLAVAAVILGIAIYVGLGAVLPAAQWHFLLWTILAGWVLGSMNDIVYHQGLVDEDSLQASTSFDCDFFGQAFLSGANRHAEHHLYPAVPGPRLVAVSKILRSELQAVGVPYERGFMIAFIRRLTTNPVFLPKPREKELAEVGE